MLQKILFKEELLFLLKAYKSQELGIWWIMYTLRLSCFWSLTNYQRVQGDWSPRACSLGRSGFVIITVSGFGRHLTAASQFHSYCCSKADWVSVMQWRKEDNHFTVIHHNFKGSLMDSKAVNKPYASLSKLRDNVERFNFKSLSLFFRFRMNYIRVSQQDLI